MRYSDSTNVCFRLCCTGGKQDSPASVISSETQGSWLTELFGRHYAGFLTQNHIRLLVFLLYSGYLTVSIYGCLNLKLGLNVRDLVPRDSGIKADLQVTDSFFYDYGGYAYAVIDSPVPYHTPEMQELLVTLYESLCSTPFSTKGQFWLVDFLREHPNRQGLSELELTQSLLQFVSTAAFKKYRADISFSENYQSILASKMLIRLRHVSSGNFSMIAEALRATFKAHNLPGFVYEPSFLLVDQRNKAIVNTVQNIAIAVGIVVVLSTVFIRNFIGAFLTGFSILSINIGVIGFLPYWNINLDIISMITIVMSIGFSADFVIHIVYQYVTLPVNSPDGHAPLRQSLEHVGLPILQSAISTVLGASCLAFVAAYTVEAFVKTIILVIAFGLAHGIIFLPVILSLINPRINSDMSSHYQKFRDYFTSNIPRYLGNVRNVRMNSYFSRTEEHPSNVGTRRGTVLTRPHQVPERNASPDYDDVPNTGGSDEHYSSSPKETRSAASPRQNVKPGGYGQNQIVVMSDLYGFLKQKALSFGPAKSQKEKYEGHDTTSSKKRVLDGSDKGSVSNSSGITCSPPAFNQSAPNRQTKDPESAAKSTHDADTGRILHGELFKQNRESAENSSAGFTTTRAQKPQTHAGWQPKGQILQNRYHNSFHSTMTTDVSSQYPIHQLGSGRSSHGKNPQGMLAPPSDVPSSYPHSSLQDDLQNRSPEPTEILSSIQSASNESSGVNHRLNQSLQRRFLRNGPSGGLHGRFANLQVPQPRGPYIRSAQHRSNRNGKQGAGLNNSSSTTSTTAEGELVQIVLNGKLGSRLDLAKSMTNLAKSQESLADSDHFAVINTTTNGDRSSFGESNTSSNQSSELPKLRTFIRPH